MSQVTVPTTTPPRTVMCSNALTTNVTVTIAVVLVKMDVVLLPLLIPKDTIWGVAGFTTVPQ